MDTAPSVSHERDDPMIENTETEEKYNLLAADLKLRLEVAPLESKIFHTPQTNSSESNHNLKATLAFIRLDLFMGARRRRRRRGARQIEAAAVRVITKHLRQTSQGSL